MATRFYFTSSTTAPANSPGFGAWTRTNEAVRRKMNTVKDGTAMANTTAWANTSPAANGSALFVQWHSEELAAGIAFSTTDTIKCVIRCLESAANDNINRTPLRLAVYNGTTLQATLKALGAYGPNTTEWNTSLRNKQLADGDTLDANYTTVAGDYLVLEVGGQVDATGGTSVTGSMSFGSNSASDLAENETGTAANNPWFEISRNLTFVARDSVDVAWNVRAAIQDTVQLAWNVRGLVQDTSQSAWNVRGLGSDSVALAWNVRGLGSDSVALAWNVRGLASDNVALAWHVRGLAGDNVVLAWNVAAIQLTQVQDTLDLAWNVRAAVSDSASLAWNIRSLAGDTVVLAWNTRATIQDLVDLAWNVRQLVQDSQALAFNVRALAGDSVDLAWAVRNLARQDVNADWNVRALVQGTLQLAWNVLENIVAPGTLVIVVSAARLYLIDSAATVTLSEVKAELELSVAYDLSEQPRLTLRFRNADGDLADPSNFTLTIQKPSGTTIQKSLADCTRTGTGVYYYEVALDEAGRWFYRAVSTNFVAAAETFFDVRESQIT